MNESTESVKSLQYQQQCLHSSIHCVDCTRLLPRPSQLLFHFHFLFSISTFERHASLATNISSTCPKRFFPLFPLLFDLPFPSDNKLTSKMKTSQVFRISAQTKGATFTSRISHGISKPFRAPPSPKWDGKIMKKVAAAAKSSFHRVPLSNSPVSSNPDPRLCQND